MKRIISFSLWGSNPKYTIGALENVKLQKELYPDWICRFYVDPLVPVQIIWTLQEQNAEIVYKDPSEGYMGLFWRFEPAFENDIERFIVRDCDSRLNQREAAAVQEWIDSKLPFHCMRDHKGHDIPVLGAMWGATGNFLPDFKDYYEKFIALIKSRQMFLKRDQFFYTDQTFLNQVIWPRIAQNAIVHDDQKRFTGTEKPFTVTLPDGQFIGQQWGADNKPLPVPL